MIGLKTESSIAGEPADIWLASPSHRFARKYPRLRQHCQSGNHRQERCWCIRCSCRFAPNRRRALRHSSCFCARNVRLSPQSAQNRRGRGPPARRVLGLAAFKANKRSIRRGSMSRTPHPRLALVGSISRLHHRLKILYLCCTPNAYDPALLSASPRLVHAARHAVSRW
jgi:hypothetical protein